MKRVFLMLMMFVLTTTPVLAFDLIKTNEGMDDKKAGTLTVLLYGEYDSYDRDVTNKYMELKGGTFNLYKWHQFF